MLRLIEALFISGICTALAQSPVPAGKFAGRDVVLSVVDSGDLSPIPWGGEKLSLTVETTLLESGSDVFTLLQANRIAPDGEAFALVYDLNPTARHGKKLEPGTKVLLPKLSSERALKDLSLKGYLVLLTLDPELRASIERELETTRSLAGAFASLPDAGSPDKYARVKEHTAYISSSFAEMQRRFARRTSPPQRKATLEQLHRELEVINALLQKALAPGAQLNTQDLDQIAAIREDIEAAMEAYEQALSNDPPKADGLYKVLVSITGPTPTSVVRYRVYYTNYGLYRDPPDRNSDAFRVPGSRCHGVPARAELYDLGRAGRRPGSPPHRALASESTAVAERTNRGNAEPQAQIENEGLQAYRRLGARDRGLLFCGIRQFPHQDCAARSDRRLLRRRRDEFLRTDRAADHLSAGEGEANQSSPQSVDDRGGDLLHRCGTRRICLFVLARSVYLHISAGTATRAPRPRRRQRSHSARGGVGSPTSHRIISSGP
jgi:tetratricopeptide (TPR) repeat protein